MVLLVRGGVVCLMEFNKTVRVVSRWCCGCWVGMLLGSGDVTGVQVDQYANTQHKYTIEIPGGSSVLHVGEGVVPGT